MLCGTVFHSVSLQPKFEINGYINCLFVTAYLHCLYVLLYHSLEWKQWGETMNSAKKIRQIKMTLKHEIAKIQAHYGTMNESRLPFRKTRNAVVEKRKLSISGIFPWKMLRMRFCKILNSMKWISINLKYRKLIAYAH